MVAVPNLVRKLNLLIDYGQFPDMTELAKAFGKRRTTVYGWARAKGGGEDVPADSHDILVNLFFRALKESLPREEIVALLAADSAFPLEEEFNAVPMKPFGRLLEEEADTTCATLIIAERDGIGLVETDAAPDHGRANVVRLGQWFRVEFRSSLAASQIIVLQHAGQKWGLVPHHFDDRARIIYVPGVTEAGYRRMRERSDLGSQRFIAMHTKAPLPPGIRNLIGNSTILDSRLLNRLARHYERQTGKDRALFLLNLTVVDPSE